MKILHINVEKTVAIENAAINSFMTEAVII